MKNHLQGYLSSQMSGLFSFLSSMKHLHTVQLTSPKKDADRSHVIFDVFYLCKTEIRWYDLVCTWLTHLHCLWTQKPLNPSFRKLHKLL